jgi:4-azaleucine resistance transporter AzlC
LSSFFAVFRHPPKRDNSGLPPGRRWCIRAPPPVAVEPSLQPNLVESEPGKDDQPVTPIDDLRRGETLKKGAAAAWPICLGYIPIGLAFGVLAQKIGLSPVQIGLMSLLVFAGSAQFIAVSMLASGASAASIIATTFMVNLRHLLMSSSLAVYLVGRRRTLLSLFAYGITDESYGVNLDQFRSGRWGIGPALALNHTANIAWVLSTVAGGYGGQFIPPGAFGIDFALTAMFICLLVFQLRDRRSVVAAAVSGIAAVLLSVLIPGNLYIVLASAAAATAGLLVRPTGRKEA